MIWKLLLTDARGGKFMTSVSRTTEWYMLVPRSLNKVIKSLHHFVPEADFIYGNGNAVCLYLRLFILILSVFRTCRKSTSDLLLDSLFIWASSFINSSLLCSRCARMPSTRLRACFCSPSSCFSTLFLASSTVVCSLANCCSTTAQTSCTEDLRKGGEKKEIVICRKD